MFGQGCVLCSFLTSSAESHCVFLCVVIRVHSAAVAGSASIGSASVRAGVSSTLGGARFLSSGAAFRSATVIADQRTPAESILLIFVVLTSRADFVLGL